MIKTTNPDQEVPNCGIDLHAKSSYLAIVDEQRKRIFKRNFPNDMTAVLGFLAFNWYWLADSLMEDGYNRTVRGGGAFP